MTAEPRWLAGALALLVHGFFLAALTLGVSWHSVPPLPVEAELWTRLSDFAPSAVPAPEESSPEPMRAAEAETKAPDIVYKDKTAAREAHAEPRQPESKLTPNLTPKLRREAARKAVDEEMQQALNEALAEEAKEIQRRRKMLNATASARDMQVRDFQDRIRLKIRGLLRIPPGVRGNPEAVYSVFLLPNGEVDRVALQKGSGQPEWDAAVERALLKASPLPLPPNREAAAAFRDGLTLRFRPGEER